MKSLLKELHFILKKVEQVILRKIGLPWRLQKFPNEVGNMKTPLPEEVDNLMKDLLKEYNSKKEKTFEDILDFHVQFERIHPFKMEMYH